MNRQFIPYFKNNATINSKDGIFTLKKPTSQISSFAFIQELTVLQPFTENLVTVQMHETNTSDICFVNKYESLFKKAGVTIMPGIHEGNKNKDCSNQRQLKFILTNLSPKYTIVATISSVNHSQKCTVLKNEPLTPNFQETRNRLIQENQNIAVQSTLSDNDTLNSMKIPVRKDFSITNLTDSQTHKVNKLLKKDNKLFENKEKRKLASNILYSMKSTQEPRNQYTTHQIE